MNFQKLCLSLLTFRSAFFGINAFTQDRLYSPSSTLNYISCHEQRSKYNHKTDHKRPLNDTWTANEKSRRKRAVIEWPAAATRPSQLAADFYINIPIFSSLRPNKLNQPLSIQGKYIIELPSVSWEFLEGKSLEDKFIIFQLAESFINYLGLDGQSCLQRALCERSEYHVMVDGIVGEVITLLLEFSSSSGNTTYTPYEDAQEHGKSYGDCNLKYSCPFSIFKWFDD